MTTHLIMVGYGWVSSSPLPSLLQVTPPLFDCSEKKQREEGCESEKRECSCSALGEDQACSHPSRAIINGIYFLSSIALYKAICRNSCCNLQAEAKRQATSQQPAKLKMK